MRFFLDTEFSERGPKHPIELISIGLVSESGAEFYRVSSEFDEAGCNDWVKANVLPNLGNQQRIPLAEIRLQVQIFIINCCGLRKPEFWGYYSDYDWVVFAQIFGTMVNLPKGWPMYCRDIKQLADEHGDPKLPDQTSTEHNALEDARWNKLAWEFLVEANEAL